MHRFVTKPYQPRVFELIVQQAIEKYELELERDHLVAQLKELNDELVQHNRMLDERVRERTRGLEAAFDSLRATEERYALALRGANDGIWDWDLVKNEIYLSGRWLEMLGLDHAAVGNDPREWLDRVHPQDVPRLQEDIDRHLKRELPQFENEHRIRHADGEYHWMLSRGVALFNDAGEPVRMAGSQTEITGLGVRDRLTGLPNRVAFADCLESAIRRASRRPDALIGVLYVDLDCFTIINDGAGRPFGDHILCGLADRLQVQLRLADTVACFGGDRFAVVLEELTDVADALRVAERAHIWIRRPFVFEGRELHVTASIGVAVASVGNREPAQLLHDAEEAVRQAKRAGGACTRLFDRHMSKRAATRLQLELELGRAIEENQLQVYFQPLVDLRAGNICGFEALVRWRHEERGFVPPGVFIPVAEETGQILSVGRWVLFESCRLLRALEDRFGPEAAPSVNVNASARQLERYGFVENVTDALHEYGLDADRLRVEITETALFNEVEKSVGVLTGLKDLGVELVLDDFGTGYSSLAYLSRFPIDALKIDRSFIDAMGRDASSRRVVSAIVGIAHSLGVTVTAEGIETAEQLEILRIMECEYGQGYLFSKPLAVTDLEPLLAARPSW